MTGKYPCLKTSEGTLNESVAIAKYFAYGTDLLGKSHWEQAKVDQWCLWYCGTVVQQAYPALKAILGMSTEVTQPEFTESQKNVKDAIKTINNALVGDWICGGDAPTVADYCLAVMTTIPFQTLLD